MNASKNNTSKISGIILPLLFLLFCISPLYQKENVKNTSEFFEIKKTTFINSLPVSGILESNKVQKVFPPFVSKIQALTPEGTFLNAGDFIGSLEIEDQEDNKEKYEVELEILRIDLDIKKLRNELRAFKLQNRIEFARFNLEIDELYYDSLIHGIDAAEYVRIVNSKINLEKQIKAYENELIEKKKHLKAGFVTAEDVKNVEYSLEAEKLRLKSVIYDFKLLKKGADDQKRRESLKSIVLKKIELTEAEKKLESYLKNKQNEKEHVKARIKWQNSMLENEIETIKSSILTSEISGVITYGKTWVTNGQQEKVKPGSPVYRGWAVANIHSLGKMHIITNISEVDIGKVAENMAVTFNIESFPDKEYKGVVSEINKIAEIKSSMFDRNDTGKIKHIKVTIDVTSLSSVFKPKMTVHTNIIFQKLQNQIVIPTEFININNEVLMADKTLRKIKTGQSNYTQTVVTSGLKEGEKLSFPDRSQTGSEISNKVETTVKKRDLIISVKDVGELQPEQFENIIAYRSGKLVKLVPEGTNVKKGDDIAKIDAKKHEDKLLEKELLLKKLETEKELINKKADAELYKLKEEIKITENNLKIALFEQKKLVRGGTIRERKDKKYAINMAKSEMEKINKELLLKKEILKQGIVSAQEIRDLTLRYGGKKATYEVAKVKYDLLVQGGTKNSRLRAKIKVKKEKLNLALNNKKLENRILLKELELKKNAHRLEKRKKRIEEIKKILKKLDVKSPCDGTSVYVKTFKGNKFGKIEEGDTANGTMSFLKIANLSSFIINGEVPENGIGKLKIGQQVIFNLTSDKNKKYKGVLSDLGFFAKEKSTGGMFDFLGGNSDENESKVFEIKIKCLEISPKFQPGMTVDFEIITKKYSQVLTIPISAIFSDSKGQYVYVGNMEKKYVKIGEKNIDFVIIKSGINEGDSVWLEKI